MQLSSIYVLTFLVLGALLAAPTTSVMGVDVSQLFPTSTYQCMKNNGAVFAIVRGYCSFGGPDHNAPQSLTNAKAAGLITDIYMFPCRGKSASAQVTQMFNSISTSLYGMVWIDVETNPSPGCSWSGHDAASNCQFLQEVINGIKAKGKGLGIYASQYMWQSIMGSLGACTQASGGTQLWYAHYDNSPSFSDYRAIGGWSRPNIKQYKGDTTLCGAGVDLNFYP